MNSRRAAARLPRAELWVFEQVHAALRTRPDAAVAVLVGSEPSPLVQLLRRAHPSARLTVVRPGQRSPTLHAQLAAGGRFRLIADVSGEVDDPAGRLRSVLFHLDRGGRFLDPCPDVERPAPTGVVALLERLAEIRAGAAEPVDAAERTLATATRDFRIDDGHLTVPNRVVALAKLREADVEHVMSVRGARFGHVLGRLDAERFTVRAVIRDHVVETSVRVPASFDVPPHFVRTYREATCGMRQVTVKANLVLPETYRKFPARTLDNAGIRNVAADFTQPIRGFAEAERLEGTYFSWDSEHPGHFGHILTEQVSRLWAWEIAKAAYPDIRMLVSRYSWRAEVQPAEAAVLRAIGVDPSDVVRITATTRVQRLVGATGMFCQPYYVSPRIADTWHRLAPGIVADATVQRLPKRIFVSRRGGTRDCTNVDEVEELFRSHGFQIVFPAELSFADQVAVFRGAEIVAGFAGSNMFHLMFTGPVRVLLLTSENYLPRNEELIAAVLGHELDIFWGVPVDRTNGSSPFTVDFAREGRLLREVLGSLDK